LAQIITNDGSSQKPEYVCLKDQFRENSWLLSKILIFSHFKAIEFEIDQTKVAEKEIS